MKTILVKEIMIPLSEYATVSEDATLYEAIVALDEAQAKHVKSPYSHKAILVFDKKIKLSGKSDRLMFCVLWNPNMEKLSIQEPCPVSATQTTF